MNNKIKILIVSNTPWDDSNSFGNSFSNIFGGNSNYEIANIYCQAGTPNTTVATHFFQICEKDIIRNLLRKQKCVGREVLYKPEQIDSNHVTTLNAKEQGFMSFFKLKRWQILFWLRDLIWANKNWCSKELTSFILDFNPDIIFQPVYYSTYINEIGLYAKDLIDKPMVGYMSDDNYTLKRYSVSPLFWIDRLIKRFYVKRACDSCKILYVISEMQMNEFNHYFGNKCKVLYKGADFSKEPRYDINNPLKFVYTGNIGAGRWQTLAKIAKIISEINVSGQKAILYITTPSPFNKKIAHSLNISGASVLLGKVPLSEKETLQKDADVLLHVNSFERSEKYTYRLSFSTKLVDYFETGHTILAVGWEKNADIDYLIKNDAAISVTDEKNLKQTILRIIENASILLPEHDHKSFECGKRNHQIQKIRLNLYEDLLCCIQNYKRWNYGKV